MFGKFESPLSRLTPLIDQITIGLPHLASLIPDEAQHGFLSCNAIRIILRLYYSDTDVSLGHLLTFCMGTFDATDQRDKVFALLGVCTQPKYGTTVAVDYTRPVEDIYSETALRLLQMDGIPNILTTAGFSKQTGNFSLPSWVPDWSTEKCVLSVKGAPNMFETTRGTTFSVRLPQNDPRSITIRGRIFDTVKFTLSKFPSHPPIQNSLSPVVCNYFRTLSVIYRSLLEHAFSLLPYPRSGSADGNIESEVLFDNTEISWRTLTTYNNNTKWWREKGRSLREGFQL